MNDLGKPDAGKPPVRFDEEALETGPASWWDNLRAGSKGPETARPLTTPAYRASALLYPMASVLTDRWHQPAYNALARGRIRRLPGNTTYLENETDLASGLAEPAPVAGAPMAHARVEQREPAERADALVLFGASGDLAYPLL